MMDNRVSEAKKHHNKDTNIWNELVEKKSKEKMGIMYYTSLYKINDKIIFNCNKFSVGRLCRT